MFNSLSDTYSLLFNQICYEHQHRIGFQMSAAAGLERIIDLHNFICYFLIIILFIVVWLLIILIDRFSVLNNINNLYYTNIRHKFSYYYTKYFFTSEELITNNKSKSETIIKILHLPDFDINHWIEDEEGNLELWNDTVTNYYLIGLLENSELYMKYIWSYILVSLNIQDLKFTENKYLEFSWTIIPCFILAFIAIPSFYVLYINEEILNPGLSIKIIGHQWYWSLDHTDLFPYWFNLSENTLDIDDFVIDSYMEPTEFLKIKHNHAPLRLLETEEPLFLPVKLHLRLIITSDDVLHSFAMPAMGLKVDAVPGRMNQLDLFIKRTDYFLVNAVKFVVLVMDLCLLNYIL